MAARHRMGAILLLLWCVCFTLGCDNEEVAIYEVKMKMMWSGNMFAKDYSDSYGEKAQWSPVFGQTHNRSYILYRVGEVAREAVQHLIKKGSIDELMLQGKDEPKVYDQFSTPGVGGIGETKGLVVVDGQHSLVSLISRMTPSPDWFVGVDSLDLCIDSTWVEEIALDLEPLSGGVSEAPVESDYHSSPVPVSKLGHRAFKNRMPGFYKARELQTIAVAKFTKKEVYSTEEINKLVRNDLISKLKNKNQQEPITKPRNNYRTDEEESFQDQSTKNYLDNLKDLEEEPFGTPEPNQPENNVVVVTKAPSFASNDEDKVDDELMSMDDAVLAVARGRKLGLNKHLPRHFKSRLHHAVNHRPHRN